MWIASPGIRNTSGQISTSRNETRPDESSLNDALEAAEQAKQFVDHSTVPAYQYALREEESTGNYSLDAIATVILAKRK
jgi:hypothetical protein